MAGRKLVAAVTAAALVCGGCAGNLRHTKEPHPAVRDNWGAVMRLPVGTFVMVEERSGAWTIGDLLAKDPEVIIVGKIAKKALPKSQIRRILMKHAHTDWTGIGDVGVGALAGGIIGGLAVPKHRVIAGTLLAAAGAFVGLVHAVVNMFVEEGNNFGGKLDEVLVYYTDRIAAVTGDSDAEQRINGLLP